MSKATILIVDDNPINIELLLLAFKDQYNTKTAQNGEECINVCMENPVPDLILLDVMMPVLNGFETIKVLKADKKTEGIPVILLTALSDKTALVQGFNLGAVDYLTKPVNIPELNVRVKTQLELKNRSTKIEQQKQRLKSLNTALNETFKEQNIYIEKAKLLQRNMIQNKLPLLEEFEIQALYLPCENMGGDFFLITKGIKVKKLVIIVGDCTGHGMQPSIEASLLASIVNKRISNLFETNDTSSFLTSVNQSFCKMADEDKFPTLLVCTMDLVTKEFKYSNANGVLPSVFRNGETFSLPQVSGMHLGYSEDTTFEEHIIKMHNGDRIFLYSDAVLEYQRDKYKNIKRERFEKILQYPKK
ncbi:MAG: response regulator, partial [Spirochaetales bacterium]|nr:response regulator [Spirochaetales bacterium]